jgi:hypothetical protein
MVEKLNPQFTPLQILNHKKELEELLAKELNLFPIDVFPVRVQEIIKACNQSLNYPIDFTAASILYAVSVSIGNTFKAELMEGFQQNAVIYLSIVGRAGTMKSHPLSFAISPIEKRDNEEYLTYKNRLKEYQRVSKLNKTERQEEGISEKDLVKPSWNQFLISDFTPEALAAVHDVNKRGLGVYVDELATWFNNFNRYNKGSEEQFWLSNWSGKPLRINRKTSEPINIPLPFVSVAGTIQPAVLNQLATNRTENGFIDRILFVFPEYLKKEYWSETQLSPDISKDWDTILENLLNVRQKFNETENPDPEILRFSDEAKDLLFAWQRVNTDQSNNSETDAERAICAKIEQYAIRFSLILQLLQYACSEDEKTQIDEDAVCGAIRLTEYFKRTSIRVQTMLANATPVDSLPADKRKLYEALPDEFSTAEGLIISERLEVPERTFKRFLNDKNLFEKTSRGNYRKLF